MIITRVMALTRALFVIVSFIAIANAKNNVDYALKLINPLNQELGQFSLANLVHFEQDWNNLNTRLSKDASTGINTFLSNVNKADDNYHRATDSIVRFCRSTLTVLPRFQKNPAVFNEYLSRQLNSFSKATEFLHVVSNNLELGATNLNLVNIETEKPGYKKIIIEANKNGYVDINILSRYTYDAPNSLLEALSKKNYDQENKSYSFKIGQPSIPSKESIELTAFEQTLKQARENVQTARNTIIDVIKQEEAILKGENVNVQQSTKWTSVDENVHLSSSEEHPGSRKFIIETYSDGSVKFEIVSGFEKPALTNILLAALSKETYPRSKSFFSFKIPEVIEKPSEPSSDFEQSQRRVNAARPQVQRMNQQGEYSVGDLNVFQKQEDVTTSSPESDGVPSSAEIQKLAEACQAFVSHK